MFLGFSHELSLYFAELVLLVRVWFCGGFLVCPFLSGVSSRKEGVGGGLLLESFDWFPMF